MPPQGRTPQNESWYARHSFSSAQRRGRIPNVAGASSSGFQEQGVEPEQDGVQYAKSNVVCYFVHMKATKALDHLVSL
jgi:hypothetical protein